MEEVSPRKRKRKAGYCTELFWKHIQTYRSNNELSVPELARVCNFPVKTVYKWLSGLSAPTRNNLEKLCARLGWQPDRLFSPDNIRGLLVEQGAVLQNYQQAYAEQFQADPQCGQLKVHHAAVEARAWLTSRGQPVILMISADSLICDLVWSPDSPMAGYSMKIVGQGERGIMVRWYDNNDPAGPDWCVLSELNLAKLLKLPT